MADSSGFQLPSPVAGLEPTLDAAPSGAEHSANRAPIGRELVEGKAPRLSTLIQSILQRRLRAVTLLLAFALALYLLRAMFVAYHPVVLTYQVTLFVLVLAALGLLSFDPHVPARRLRLLELALFGATAVFFGVAEYFAIAQAVAEGEAKLLVAAVKSAVLYIFALIVLYGMLIPNRWPRALAVVLPIAAIPPIVGQLARMVMPGFGPLAEATSNTHLISDNVLMLVIGVIMSVFGTHIINALREEAFAARQLGQYRLTRLLGRGGMGEVYLAEHELLKRPCAVKVIRPGRVSDSRALERFAREVRSAARLSHWNSIEIFDYGRTDDGTFFYVMEYLPGRNLEELIEKNGPMPTARVLYFLRQICDALDEAHSLGMVHRDIKPSNVFAAHRGGRFDVAKLLDFGLVKDIQPQAGPHLTFEGDITGSPLYIAPEIAAGDSFDARADIYSLGALAYFLLTGEPPFTGRNAMQLIVAHVRDPVEPPSTRKPGIPEDIERIVLRCLAKAPADRYPEVRALRSDLERCDDFGRWNEDDAAAWWNRLANRQQGDLSESPPAEEAKK